MHRYNNFGANRLNQVLRLSRPNRIEAADRNQAPSLVLGSSAVCAGSERTADVSKVRYPKFSNFQHMDDVVSSANGRLQDHGRWESL